MNMLWCSADLGTVMRTVRLLGGEMLRACSMRVALAAHLAGAGHVLVWPVQLILAAE
jgi:hypothetical protein